MSFFQEHYANIRYPISQKNDHGELPGLRRAQLGAIHTIAAHFATKKTPAIIVMPTGSGKTAVLMMTAFVLRAQRVLVVTPSRLVRSQIRDKFASLDDLFESTVLPKGSSCPKVKEVDGYVSTAADWEVLRAFDVVVGTPSSLGPREGVIAQPPPDLFDLVLIDECHHDPAKTWRSLADAFPKAKRVLFTATPFRRDDREIQGDIVFSYSVKEAFDDKIFGKVTYLPVTPQNGESSDLAIARTAQEVLLKDRADNFNHFLLVRADSKPRAKELAKLYEDETDLQLKLIHSGLNNTTIQRTVRELKEGKLDGIVCVNMLGEGFDFPNLKVAAVHTPHKSLEVTLQFVGRFARTKGERIGPEAKFLAVPADIEVETTRLYGESSIWEEIVPRLSSSRIQRETNTRQALNRFRAPILTTPQTEELSLYAIRPAFHAKIYRVPQGTNVSLGKIISFPDHLENIFQKHDPDTHVLAVVTKEVGFPKWSQSRSLEQTFYNLFVIYFDEDSRLLFINSSCRNDSIYQFLLDFFSAGRGRLLPSYQMHRVLRGLQRMQVFNLGMRNQMISQNESYQIKAGANAPNAVTETDAVNFGAGHVFVSAERIEAGQAIGTTIGYSSGSKIWSLRASKIPQFVEWCKYVAECIQSNAPVDTKTNLDLLRIGKLATNIPEGVLAAQWDESAYRADTTAIFADEKGEERVLPLVDVEISLDRANSTSKEIKVTFSAENRHWPMTFQLAQAGDDLFFHSDLPDDDIPIFIQKREEQFPLIDYVNGRPLSFYFSDFSRLCGEELFPAHTFKFTPLNDDRLKPLDWKGQNVDIEKEYYYSSPKAGLPYSIHGYLWESFKSPEFQVVIYDHGSHEVADFVAFSETNEEIRVTLYHCKKSKNVKPGCDAEDFYEVVGQAIRSIRWCHQNKRLLAKLRQRIRNRVGQGDIPKRDGKGEKSFVDGKGDLASLEAMFESMKQKLVSYEVVVVQPGISKAALKGRNMELLASCNHYLLRNGSAQVSFHISK